MLGLALNANQYRSDLASAGYGNGNHGYSTSIDWSSLPKGTLHIVVYAVDGSGYNPAIYDGTYANDAGYQFPLLVYQTKDTFYNDENNKEPEDLQVGDESTDEIKSKNLFFNADNFNKTPESFEDSWKTMCTSLFSTEPLNEVIVDMINHFMSGSGSSYSNQTLTQKVFEHQSTQGYVKSVKSEIDKLLKQNNGNIGKFQYFATDRANNPLVNLMKQDKILQPVYNTTSDKLNGLTICVDSLWGNMIEVKSYTLSGNNYSGVLHFTLYDHFGLDTKDISAYGHLAGFRSWYILQHLNSFNQQYKPFVTLMEFDVPFSGTIN